MRRAQGRLVCEGPGFVGAEALGSDSLNWQGRLWAVEREVESPNLVWDADSRATYPMGQGESSGPWCAPQSRKGRSR